MEKDSASLHRLMIYVILHIESVQNLNLGLRHSTLTNYFLSMNF